MSGLFLEIVGDQIQLQGDAGHGLLQGIMEFLGEAGAFGQHGAELDFRFLPRGHFHLQLGGTFLDTFLQLVVRLLQFVLGGFFFTDQRFQDGISSWKPSPTS